MTSSDAREALEDRRFEGALVPRDPDGRPLGSRDRMGLEPPRLDRRHDAADLVRRRALSHHHQHAVSLSSKACDSTRRSARGRGEGPCYDAGARVWASSAHADFLPHLARIRRRHAGGFAGARACPSGRPRVCPAPAGRPQAAEEAPDPRRHAGGRLLLAAQQGHAGGRGVPEGGERLRRRVHEADRGAAEEALRRDARAHPADRHQRPLPRARLLLLLAHRGGQAVPDLLPQEGDRWRRPRRSSSTSTSSPRARSSCPSAT